MVGEGEKRDPTSAGQVWNSMWMALAAQQDRHAVEFGGAHAATGMERPFADPLVGNPEKGTRRSMILPEWIGKTILVHSGKDWQPVVVNNKMVGHRLGEFVLTKKAVVHQGKLADAQKGSKKK